ncbi:MAG: hypothetical protein KJ995_08135 [Candidatus Omnitrophica bacterium]|nr:hypothetical protein [Candidatus Omnitrophota bacterium]MBU1852355.1 hypothetical protein [Candidatus Omnitrophota bacterium]
MEKVRCKKCGSYGYTASPEDVRCEKCGGDHTMIRVKMENIETKDVPITDYLRRFLFYRERKVSFRKGPRLLVGVKNI